MTSSCAWKLMFKQAVSLIRDEHFQARWACKGCNQMPLLPEGVLTCAALLGEGDHDGIQLCPCQACSQSHPG